MLIRKKNVKSIIVPSKLPESDYVINPYTGCIFGCSYCYARFMTRFCERKEEWGKFVDIKINADQLIPLNSKKYFGKNIVIGSVTDPYQYIEKKYKVTRKILEKLISLQPNLFVITKSNLIIRDIDLLKQFKKCTIIISLSLNDENIKKIIEPYSPSINKRIEMISAIHNANIKTVLFISPILPVLTDWKFLIEKTLKNTDEYWFENLNMYSSNRKSFFSALSCFDEDLIKKIKRFSTCKMYWRDKLEEIKFYCEKKNINHKLFFHL